MTHCASVEFVRSRQQVIELVQKVVTHKGLAVTLTLGGGNPSGGTIQNSHYALQLLCLMPGQWQATRMSSVNTTIYLNVRFVITISWTSQLKFSILMKLRCCLILLRLWLLQDVVRNIPLQLDREISLKSLCSRAAVLPGMSSHLSSFSTDRNLIHS